MDSSTSPHLPTEGEVALRSESFLRAYLAERPTGRIHRFSREELWAPLFAYVFGFSPEPPRLDAAGKSSGEPPEQNPYWDLLIPIGFRVLDALEKERTAAPEPLFKEVS